MLTAKYSRKHGMRNEKWTTKEKSAQYRAILKLYEREKRLQAINGEKWKRKTSRTMKELKNDIQEYRSIVNDTIYGDKRVMRSYLQSEKDLQKFLNDAIPLEAFNVIFQDFNLKRKQLDKLLYHKVLKEKDICSLKGEYEDLMLRLELKNEPLPVEVSQQRRQQELIARYQVALAKRHAAQAIGDTYRELFDLLRKDSKYFDGVLQALRSDQRDQCRIIFKTTVMGQLAVENLDDIRMKYKVIAREVWVNMKERERSLEYTKKKAENVWEFAKSLVRIESDTNVAKKSKSKAMDRDQQLKRQIQHLEEIFTTMQESMLIRSYEELFVRLESQMMQRERLREMSKNKRTERNYTLNKKTHAELMLKTLQHSTVSTTTRYKVEKKEMLQKIADQKERETQNLRTLEAKGELLMNIRGALQNISSMLLCVRVSKSHGKGKDAKKAAKEMEGKSIDDMKNIDPCKDEIETEALAVLGQVTKKATALFAYTTFQLDKAKVDRAKDMYENYLADFRSNQKFGDEEPEPSGMYFEHETLDPNVLTRHDIKMKSKHLVEANTKVD